jgi:hypothetical protein
MKLSQKLLGLASLAVADYACCPYDDYGMPDPLCAAVLREKTPFEGSDRWMDNECKAWESNVDATYEGNNRDGGCAPNNWGSCGFQRHFPWKEFTLAGEAEALSMDNFGGLDFNTAPAGLLAPFNAGNTFLTTTSTLYNLGGLPFLGGMCKLFIPVPPASIVQVQVAGVHKQGTSFAQFPARATANSIALSGTAYCFSVVNVHETRDNTNNVNNGNVAGYGVGGTNGRTDVFDGLNSLARQAGVAFGGAYGTALTSQGDVDLGTAAEGEVKAGNNFDVVAHFADAWCESGKWSTVEMQLTGDENNDDADYPIDQNTAFSHAHNDIQDKRHNTIGYGDLYTVSGTNSDYLERAEVTLDATPIAAQDLVRWPNSGAWAGYFSFVVCAKTGTLTFGDLTQNVWGTAARETVMSVSASDYRVDTDAACTTQFANFRFNVRQVGADVELCGPGQLPDTDSKRCTWNWNYNASSTFGTSNTNDPEGFFDRSEQMTIDSWTRKRRGVVTRTDATANNVAAVLGTTEFTFTFRDQDLTSIATAASTLTSDVGQVAIADHVATLACTNTGSATQRDSFPTCFTGDEVHFNLAYTPSALDDVRKAVSPWFSSVTTNFAAV